MLVALPVSAAQFQVSPLSKHLDIQEGDTVEHVVTYFNGANEPRTIDVDIRAFIKDDTQAVFELGGKKVTNELTQFITVEPSTFIVPSGADASVTVRVSPKKIASGEYDFGVFFTEQARASNTVQGGSQIRTSLASLVEANVITQAPIVVCCSGLVNQWYKEPWVKGIIGFLVFIILADIVYRVVKGTRRKKLSQKYNILDESDL